MELSAREQEILDFERDWWARPGPKEARIRESFACSASTYYRMLGTLIDRAAALAYDPLTVKRLQRTREHRRRVRIEGRRAPGSR